MGIMTWTLAREAAYLLAIPLHHLQLARSDERLELKLVKNFSHCNDVRSRSQWTMVAIWIDEATDPRACN